MFGFVGCSERYTTQTPAQGRLFAKFLFMQEIVYDNRKQKTNFENMER